MHLSANCKDANNTVFGRGWKKVDNHFYTFTHTLHKIWVLSAIRPTGAPLSSWSDVLCAIKTSTIYGMMYIAAVYCKGVAASTHINPPTKLQCFTL